MAPTTLPPGDGADGGTLEPWEKKTDELFRTKPIEEIKVAQRKNRDAIEQKKAELRQLVTDRYRDLIEAADTVVTMASSAAEVVASAHKMQDVCQNIQLGSRQFGEASYDRSDPSDFYTKALQMKLLMDAPEQIWSALEERNFFRAANMYVTSKFIFDSIQNERDSANRKLSKSFPILFRQWDSIHPFKDNIVRTAREFLTSSQPEEASIEAVAAVMVVEQLTNVAALRWYLDVKSAAVAGAFTAAPSTGAGTAVDPTQRICTVVGSITQALRHVNALFGNGGDADTTEDAGPEVGSGLGKVSRFLSRAVSPDRPEAAGGLFLSQALPATVRNFRPPLARGALEKLPVETLQEACAKWFQELSSVVEEGVGRTLRQVNAVGAVVGVRNAAWTLLRDEYAVRAPGIVTTVADDTGPWGGLCRRVLGGETELWAAFLQQPVMMRAQTVFTSMFRVSVEATLTAASAVTKEIKAGNTEVAEESDVGRRLWTHRKLQPNSGESNHPPTLKSEDTHTSAVGLAACPPSVRKVVEAFASTLADVVAQSRLLLDDRGDTATRGLNDPPPPFDLLGDAIEIRRFLQAACEKCVDDLVANIDKEVAAILAADDSFAVDRVLFLGRVCRETVQHVKQIEELMMLPASGKSALEGGKFVARTRRAANRRAAPTEHDTRLAAVRDKLLKACGRCYEVWTERLSVDRAQAFSRRLLGHDWEGMVVEKRTWQRHAINEETESGQKVESVVLLPSQASSYLLTLLCNVCVEVSRVGGHTVELETIGALADALFDKCIAAYTELLSDQFKQKLSQDATLQIWFDLCFVGDILIGATHTAQSSARHTLLNGLVEQCKKKIDPFDLVIFNPLLEASRTKMYHRSVTLLGYFTQLRPPPTGAQPTLSSSEQSNTMAVADEVNRFPLLPISAGGSLKSSSRGAKPKRSAPPAAHFAL